MNTLLPADIYMVVNKSIITELDRKNLITFYEPIIGHLSATLYLTLLNDLDGYNITPRDLTHHHLMSILKCPLKVIKEARESLEAVGLLKTYVKQGNINNYIYEIYSPLTPSEFFNHPILNVVLYDNIGAQEYDLLCKRFQKVKIDTKEYQDITKKMDEVYTPVSNISAIDIQERSINDIDCSNQIDFDLIAASIPKGILNEKAFNKKTKELINQIAFIYKIDSLKMMELIRSVLNEFGMIDKTNLRLVARKMYQFHNGALPTLIYRSQPEYLKSPVGDTSMRGKIIQVFESLNPVDFLRKKYHGAKPTNRDIKIIEDLIIDQELTPAVVNVLLDYVLRKNNNKLSQAYIEAIAGQWKRAGLKTAREAMEFAEKENSKITKKMSPTTTRKTSSEPVWFNKNNEQLELTQEEKQEMENMFKEFK